MSAWEVAGSLESLRAQLDAFAPKRSKSSDGSIGDAAHASRASDHNPWLVIAGQAYVTARDFTHDPAGGLDCHRLAAALERGQDPRVKYVIWDRRIMSGSGGPSPWKWRPYSGSNPHTKHLHLSVVADARALSRIAWPLPWPAADRPTPTPRPPAPAPKDDDAMSWTAQDGAPKVPDHYAPGLAPMPDPLAALAWATAHAAHARDRAVEATQQVRAAREEIAALRAELATRTPSVQIDYAELARELIAAAKGA